MMKKLLFLMCVIALSITALASCGEECEHPVSSDWDTDSNYHWHPTTCEHGEFRQDYAAHADADENGVCDVCAYEIGHTHTFSSEWSKDEEKHWKDATCSHTGEKAEESLHLDDDANGECDACKAHVHILDGAGFCTGCNTEVKPVDEFDIGSVISATTARTHNVIGGTIYDYSISRWADESKNLDRSQTIEFFLGTNGTYRKWSYDEVGDDGVKTGKTEILEQWLRIVGGEVEGVDAISVDGVYKFAQPGSFSADDLSGYYYTLSNLGDGYGAEQLLYNIYNAYVENKTEDAVIVHDAENNKYDFSHKLLVVSEYKATDASGAAVVIYNANYFDLKISFTYANDYTLTSLDIKCDVWTNDAGTDYETGGLAPIDFTYDPETGMTWLDDPIADSYEISVIQTIGTREELELNDGSEFIPDSFTIYTDEACTTPLGDSFTVDVADVQSRFYVAVPEGYFLSFVKNDFETSVIDKNGNTSNGLMIVLVENEIQILPILGGEYTVTFSALGITKTATATVIAPELQGEKFFTVEVLETYSWSSDWMSDENPDGVVYEFAATTSGEYTFYLPVNFGVMEKGSSMAFIDPFDPNYDLIDVYSFTKTLRAGQVFRFYFGAVAKAVYTIGYDAP